MWKPESHRPPDLWSAVLIAVASVMGFVVAAVVYLWLPAEAPSLVKVGLAGDKIKELVGEHRDAYLQALWVDFVFVLGYGVALTGGAWLARRLFFTTSTRQLAQAALIATAFAVVAGVGEIATLLLLLSGTSAWGGWAVAAQAFAFTKWSLVLPAAVVASFGIGTTLWRAATAHRPRPELTVTCPAFDEDHTLTQPGISRAAWRAHSKLPDHDCPPDGDGAVGICISGGGIRSATFALGALDAVRQVLTKAQWLVAVSGGGYAAGALQLALQPLADSDEDKHEGWKSVAQAADVYGAGSSELEHTRLHGRYLADGPREWAELAMRVLRGFLMNMLTLAVLVVVLGRLLAHSYPFVDGYPWISPGPSGTLGTPPTGVLWTAGVLAAAWLLLRAVTTQVKPDHKKFQRLRAVSDCALGVAGVVALAGLGLPLLAWAFRAPKWAAPGALSIPSVSLVVGYLVALSALAKQPSVRAAVGREVSRARGWWRTAGSRGRNLAATVVVYLGLLALTAGFVVLLGTVLAHTGPVLADSTWPGQLPEWVITLLLMVGLGVLIWADQVRWSLHPFYRERLASAFAVRRLRQGGRVVAKPYDFRKEGTNLASYGTQREGFPEVIFCCAAHVSGEEAPPGRRVVPWTMSGRCVGGQTHGWVSTGELHSAVSVSPILKSDLTVQAAQAISGAAFASQMGVQQRVYSKFLTLTNIRLGSWLPNPTYLKELQESDEQQRWALPRLPRARRLTTLARELAGAFRVDGPLVYVTDGGHYENLGLVELLRRRPAVVYCIDASCDHGGVPRALAAAIELAREELGADIEFDDNAAHLGAGPDHPPANPTDQLNAQLMNRLAVTSVITGTITYPDLGYPYHRATAKIVVGKTVLTATTPFALLAYASNHPTFPSDNTSDQWFDASQFDAYHSLGHHVGRIMLERMPPPLSADGAPAHPAPISGSRFPSNGEILSRHIAAHPPTTTVGSAVPPTRRDS